MIYSLQQNEIKDNTFEKKQDKTENSSTFDELYNTTTKEARLIKEKQISTSKYDELSKKYENFEENAPTQPKYNELLEKYQESIKKIDDVILKKYISRLSELGIIPLEKKYNIFNQNKDNKDECGNEDGNILFSQKIDDVKIFKINKMVYEKDEFALHKFATVFNVFSSLKTSFFVIIDSDNTNTDFYMGIRSEHKSNSVGEMIKSSMEGQFSGIDIKKISLSSKKNPENGNILKKINEKEFKSISSVSCVADTRDENLNDNNKFVQGLEKLVLSMQGKKYTGIILANTTTQKDLNLLRTKYEQIYTQLSSFVSKQLSYGSNFSIGESKSNTISVANTITNTLGMTFTEQNTHSVSTSEKDPTSKAINATASVLAGIGIAGAPFTGGLSLVACGLAGCLGAVGNFFEKTTTVNDSHSKSKAINLQNNQSKTIERADTEQHSVSQGMENSVTLNFKDKTIEDILFRIEKQLKRIDEFESLGMFQFAAYFMSEVPSIAEIVASTYKSIVCGNNSGVENSAVNTWLPIDTDNKHNFCEIIKYVKNFIHPIFKYSDGIEVTPCSMVSGNELAILMGLPRKSVFGFPVLEHADFGKQVVTYDLDFDSEESKPDSEADSKKIELGCIFNMGKKYENNKICLDKESLSMHTFITGTTGSGKSNTIYELINQLSKKNVRFMVIEPAKGEYKKVFKNNNSDIKILGTDPRYSDILKIDPFKFPEKIHIFQHIDRLVEIFNVCWPMYAAMPAFLKKAILKAYENKEWDFVNSKNKSQYYDSSKNKNIFYPTFSDILKELEETIKNSSYSDELKRDYIGSLVTRVESLANGINGEIFTSNEIDSIDLFDKNVIVDLSDIPSLETKSLIMGILIMRLTEYRMANFNKINSDLEHVTVLEEAHNILKRTSKEQNPEYPSISGKSVEMISNAIAEMRTYGEGFIIVDQSPNEVDLSAIRNTNTKIIMRLPDEMDRRLAGKSAGLKEEQLDEIVKLPKGVAVVYQNNWVEPVLCKIKKYGGNG